MNDCTTNTVMLSERSLPAVAGDAKDLYLPRLPAFPSKRDARVAALISWSPSTMSDPSTITVILSERSESKDLYLPRLPAFPSKRDSRVAALIPYSSFAMNNPSPFRCNFIIPIRTERHS